MLAGPLQFQESHECSLDVLPCLCGTGPQHAPRMVTSPVKNWQHWKLGGNNGEPGREAYLLAGSDAPWMPRHYLVSTLTCPML
jgi:hypothetical protein